MSLLPNSLSTSRCFEISRVIVCIGKNRSNLCSPLPCCIGFMTNVCVNCGTMKWKGEAPGMCCPPGEAGRWSLYRYNYHCQCLVLHIHMATKCGCSNYKTLCRTVPHMMNQTCLPPLRNYQKEALASSAQPDNLAELFTLQLDSYPVLLLTRAPHVLA